RYAMGLDLDLWLQRLAQPLEFERNCFLFDLLEELGRQAGSHVAAFEEAARVATFALNMEQSGNGDRVAFHSGYFSNFGDATRTVFQTANLHDYLNGAGDKLASGFGRHVHTGHQDHVFQTLAAVARRVGVDCGHGSGVTGVHGLQHVERFFTPAFPEDDAVGTHTQCVDHKHTLRNLTLAFDVGRTGLHTDPVLVLQAQFSRVFDCDDAFARIDVCGQRVEQSGFTGAGTSAYDQVDSA